MSIARLQTRSQVMLTRPIVDALLPRPVRALAACALLLIASAGPLSNGSAGAAPAAQTQPAGGNGSSDLEALRVKARASTQHAVPQSTQPVAPPSPQPATSAESPTTQPIEEDTSYSMQPAPVQLTTHPAIVPRIATRPAFPGAVRPTTPIGGVRQPTTTAGVAGYPADTAGHSATTRSAAAPGAPEGPGAASQPTTQRVTTAPSTQPYAFNYFETPWSDVLDDFSRISGYTIIGDSKSVTGNLTFRSASRYNFAEALFQLNELLLMRTSKMLLLFRGDARHGYYLELGRLPDLIRNIPPEYMYNTRKEFEAARLGDHVMSLVVYAPPPGWPPIDIIDQFRPRVEDYYGTQVYGDKLVLTGMARDHRKFFDIVDRFVSVNPTPPSGDFQWRTIKLKNAKAGDVQQTLRQMYPPTAVAPRPGQDPDALKAKEIQIIADIRNNSLIIKATDQKAAEIEKVARDLDNATVSGETITKVIKIENGSPDEVAGQLRTISQTERQKLNDPQKFTPPEEAEASKWDVYGLPGSPNLIIVGGAKGLARAEELIKTLDVTSAPTRRERVVLKHANAAEIVPILSAMFMQPGKQPGVGAPLFSPDISGNAVIVSGKSAGVDEALKIIEQLDQPAPVNEHDHLVKLEKASPTELAGALQQLATAGVPGKPGGRQPPKFIGNEASGYLLVRCSDDDWARFENLINELDGKATESTPSLKTYRLAKADAGDVAAMLQPMFSGQPLKKGQPPAIVKITPDSRDNSLRVWATGDVQKMIAEMLPDLDLPPSDASQVRTIVLKRGDATAISQVLLQAFGPAAKPPGPGAAMGQMPTVKITPEPITNSLLVIAPKVDFEQIAKLAAEMDAAAVENPPYSLTVPVKNRPAAEVADALKALVAPGAGGKPPKPGEAAMKIVATGDQVLLDGPKDAVMRALDLIASIDVASSSRVVKQYRVTDPEEAEKALRTLMMGGAAGGGKPGAAPSAGGVQIYADTYRNIIIVTAPAQEIPQIDKYVEAIEKETTPAPPDEGHSGDWAIVKLEHRDARDVAYDLDDIFNPPGKKGGPEFRIGPNDRMLLVRCKPRELPEIERMAKMFDVEDTTKPIGGNFVIKTVKEGLSSSEIARLMAASYQQETGRTIEVTNESSVGEIQVIDIHAGEAPRAPTTSGAKDSASPCVMPTSLLRAIELIVPAQSADGSLGDDFRKSERDNAASNETRPSAATSAPTSRPVAEKPLRIIELPGGKLVIEGPPDAVKRAEEIYAEVVKEAEQQNAVLKIFPIKYAPDVNDIAQRLESIFNQQSAAPAAAQPQQPQPNQPGQPQPQPGQPGAAAGPPAAAGGRADRRTGRGAPAAATGAGGRIRVIPDARTRQLFVRAMEADFPLIIAVLKTLDVETQTARNFRIFWLKNLDATQTAQMLRETLSLDARPGFGQQGGRRFQMPGQQPGQPNQPGQPQPGQPQPGQQGQPGGQPGAEGGMVTASAETTTITADQQTNAVVVSAPPDVMKMIANTIDELEKAPNLTQPTMKRIELKYARAAEVANNVREVIQRVASNIGGGAAGVGGLGGRGGGRPGGQVSVNADARTNSVIVAGAANDVEKAIEIIKELDVETGDDNRIRIFPVKGDSNAMATALREMYAKPGASGAVADVVITADAATGNVLVKAPPQTMSEIAATIQEMEKKLGETIIPRTIKLQLADVDSVAKKLEAVFAERGQRGVTKLKIVPISSTKSLVVTATDELYKEIESMAKALDVQSIDIEIRQFKLKHAKAAEVVDKMKDLLAQVVARTQTGAGSDLNLGTFSFTPDPLTNSLIVVGNPMTFLVVQKVLDSLDVEASAMTKREVRSYVLGPGVGAAQVAANINQLFAGQAQDKSGIPPPTVTSEPNTNLVLVTATEPQHTDIFEKVIKPILDKAVETARTTRIIEILHSDAKDVAQALTNALNARQAQKGGGQAATISAMPGGNKIIAFCSEPEFKDIEELIKKIDVTGGTREVHVVTMPAEVKARTVADAINKIYGGQGTGGVAGVKAEANDPTNTVLVFATEPEFEKINRDTIQKLSEVKPVSVVNTYFVKLKFAVADEVAKTLDEFFRGKQGLTQGRFFDGFGGGGGGGGPSGEKALEDRVTVKAEAGSNMLIIACTESTKKVVDEIVAAIDNEDSTGKNVVEMFPLKYINASDMLGILEEYLKVAQRTSGEDPQAGVPWWARQPNQKQEEKTILVGGTRLKAIDTQNSIIVVGKPETMTRVKEIIDRFDKQTELAGGVGPKIIQLVNTNPAQVAATLSKVFSDTSRSQGKQGGYPAPIIVAENNTRSVIVKASPSDFTLIERMIKDLDARTGPEMGAVQLVSVPQGVNVVELSKSITKVLNEMEEIQRAQSPDYKPDRVTIEPDIRSNSLIVAASKSKFDEVQRLVAQLATRGPTGGVGATFIKMDNARPEDIQKLIEQMQRNRGGQRSDSRWKRELRNDPRHPGRTELASAVRFPQRYATFASAVMCVAMAQGAAATQPVVSTIRRSAASTQPEAVASTPVGVNPAVTDPNILSAQLSGAPLTIQSGPNGLIVIGTEEDRRIIEHLVRLLDKDMPKIEIEYVALKNAQAVALAKSLQDVYVKVEAGRPQGSQPRPEDKVAFIADPRTNGIYVAAAGTKMKDVLETIRKGDLTPTMSQGGTRTFVLKHRRARDVEPTLRSVVEKLLAKQGITDKNTIGITKDDQVNSLFVTGGEKDLDEVGKVIQELDKPAPKPDEDAELINVGTADIMIVPLRVATADKLAAGLNKLITDAATGQTATKDFIRRLRVLDEKGNPIAELNIDGPTFVVGDVESNSLVVAGPRKNLMVLRQIIKQFDVEPLRDEVTLEVRPLNYADASEVAEQLKKMLEEAKKLTARAAKTESTGGVPDSPTGVLVYNAVVMADPRTNTIVLAGRPDEVKVLTDLVTKIDVKGVGLMPFEIIKLEYASSTALESVLDDLMKKRGEALPKGTSSNSSKSETVIIKGDPRSETLIVAARADRLAEVKELVAKLDVKAMALIDNIRTIQLKNGNAADLAKKIDELWTKRAEQKQTGNIKLEKPAIIADERSNSLVVAAALGDFEAIQALVTKLESLPFGPIAEIRIVQLRYNSAKELAPVFKKLFDERAKQREGTDGKTRPSDMVAIENDPVTNSILIACSKENFELMLNMLRTLDVEAGVAGVADLFTLKNVEVARVKKTLDDTFKDGLYKPGGGAADSTAGKARDKVTVATEDRSNTLIVSASPENMSIIRKIVAQMDDVLTPWNLTNTKLYQLQYADAVKLAAQLADYFKKLDESANVITKEKTEVPLTVIADERTNRLLVGGSRDGLTKAESLIKELDVPPEPSSMIQVYRLHDGAAAKIGPMLETIFKERNQPRGGAGTGASVQSVPVTIKIDETSNALVISASREDQTLIKSVIGLLDRPSNILDQVKLFALRKARADSIKKILEELYKGGGSSGGTGGGSGASAGPLPVAVTTDPRTNAIVVAAPPGEMQNIEKLVERLDTAMPIDEAQIGIFPLENADAKKTADLLKEIMTGNLSATGGGGTGGSSGSSSSTQREIGSMLISFIKTDPRGREAFFKTIRENVQVSYDERTNAVIVVAPPSSVALIKNLVKTLDDRKKRDVFVRVFTLRNADATKSVELLEKIFAQDKGSTDQAAFQEGREIKVEGGGGVESPAGTPATGGKGTFGKPKTTFSADVRTNSVVVAGWPEDINVAGDILDQLDSQDVRDRISTVYSLQNAKAEDVVTALDGYFQKQSQILDKQNEGISQSRKAEQEVSAVAHKESNQIILSFSPRYQTQVLDIVRDLDRPPPQVMIQVLLAEVTLDNRFELGMEFALQNLRFSETAVADANGILQSSHFDVVGGTDLGAAASSGGLGGFSFTITGEDFNFLVRSLQSDSKLEVLQRPMIMCQDNQDASINVGQSVPFLTGSQTTDNGQVNSTIEYKDIGVKLDVTPHINPDGFVYMKVKPEISQLTPSTITFGNGITSPIFSKRDAETTVVVKDGETVVIGGLITTSEQESENKVPILGDLPGVGVLFRATTRTKQKTELLIVLTPRVVRTPEDARRISIENRDVTSVLTDDQKQSPLMNKLRVTPESDSQIIPPGGEEEMPPIDGWTTSQPGEDGGGPTYGPFAPEYGPFSPQPTTETLSTSSPRPSPPTSYETQPIRRIEPTDPEILQMEPYDPQRN